MNWTGTKSVYPAGSKQMLLYIVHCIIVDLQNKNSWIPNTRTMTDKYTQNEVNFVESISNEPNGGL